MNYFYGGFVPSTGIFVISQWIGDLNNPANLQIVQDPNIPGNALVQAGDAFTLINGQSSISVPYNQAVAMNINFLNNNVNFVIDSINRSQMDFSVFSGSGTFIGNMSNCDFNSVNEHHNGPGSLAIRATKIGVA